MSEKTIVQKEKSHIVYLDILRILACLLVVGVHVSAYKIHDLPVRSFAFGVTWAADWLSLLGVPLFAMISGALVLSPQYQAEPGKMVKKKFLHFFFLYYVWKFLYQIYTITGPGFFTWEHVKEFVLLQPSSHYHLWFLSMIGVMYLFLPIVKPAFESNRKLCQYYLGLFFIIALLLPECLQLLGQPGAVLYAYYGKHDFGYVAGYLGYFVLGHYLYTWGPGAVSQARDTRKLEDGNGADGSIGDQQKNTSLRLGIISIYAAGILSMLFVVVYGFYYCGKMNAPQDFLTSPMSATSFCGAAAIFVLVQRICSRPKLVAFFQRPSAMKVLRELASLTLGIYLIHPFVMERLGDHGISTVLGNPVWSIPMMVLLLAVICGVISWMIGKFPFLSKLIKQ